MAPKAAHVTGKAVCAAAPAITETGRGFGPLTVQLAAPRATVWSPANRPEIVTDPLLASTSPAPPSTATV